MNFLLTNESDCRLFKFWFRDRLCDGIRYQDELFLKLHSFDSHRRNQAYDLGLKLLDHGISVIICCSEKRYSLGVNLRNFPKSLLESEEQQTSGKVQQAELILSQLLR